LQKIPFCPEIRVLLIVAVGFAVVWAQPLREPIKAGEALVEPLFEFADGFIMLNLFICTVYLQAAQAKS
jgi:hypothetical protein